MRCGRPATQPWSAIVIDASKDMNAKSLTNLGDIVIGANKLKTTNLLIKQLDANQFVIRNLADDADKSVKLYSLTFTNGITAGADNLAINAPNVDSNYIKIMARDNTSGLIEVARIVGAADPYVQMSLPMVLKPGSVPGTPVEGHFWYDDTAKKLRFRDTAATVTILGGVAAEGTLALFQTTPATGNMTTPEEVNNDTQAGQCYSSTVGHYAEVDYGKLVQIRRFRLYGYTELTGDGEFKIQYYSWDDYTWKDWKIDILCRTTLDFSDFVTVGSVLTDKIRLVVTKIDTYGVTGLRELEVIY
ncbi:hypothetical protein ES703_25829 [subsurface metagenome]